MIQNLAFFPCKRSWITSSKFLRFQSPTQTLCTNSRLTSTTRLTGACTRLTGACTKVTGAVRLTGATRLTGASRLTSDVIIICNRWYRLYGIGRRTQNFKHMWYDEWFNFQNFQVCMLFCIWLAIARRRNNKFKIIGPSSSVKVGNHFISWFFVLIDF